MIAWDFETEKRQVRLWERQMAKVNWLYVVKWGSLFLLTVALAVAVARSI